MTTTYDNFPRGSREIERIHLFESWVEEYQELESILRTSISDSKEAYTDRILACERRARDILRLMQSDLAENGPLSIHALRTLAEDG